MPIKTRFELFKQSADRFVRQFHRKYYRDVRTMNYKIVNNRENGATSSYQWYTIKMNKKFLSYENTITGEKVYEDIVGLTSDIVKAEVNDFYRPYQIENDEGEVISYCEVNGMKETDTEIKCCVAVLYHNRYEKPFPNEERDIEQIERLARELKHQKKVANANSMGRERMVHTIRDLFAKLPTKTDCPICYVEMTVTKLAVNPCCHLLCSDCNNRLVRDKKGCPECRGVISLC